MNDNLGYVGREDGKALWKRKVFSFLLKVVVLLVE